MVHGRRQLLPRHHEVAVARQRDHRPLGVRALGRDPGGKAVAHRPAGRREMRVEAAEAVIPVQPDREVAGPVGQDRVLGQRVAHVAQDLAQLQRTGVGARLLGPVEVGGAGPGHPFALARRVGAERGQARRQAARGRVDAESGLVDAPDLVGVGMDVHQRLVACRNRQQVIGLRRDLGHAATRENHQIGVAHGLHQRGIGAEAQVAREVRVLHRHLTRAAELGGEGDGVAFAEVGEGGHGLGVPAGAAEDRERLLRLCQHVAQTGEVGGGGGGFHRLHPRRVGDRDHVVQHVLGQRDHHRAGAALHGDAEGASQKFGDAGGVVDLDHPFGHRAEDRAVVEFLERLAVFHPAGDLAHEEDHRGRILRGDMHARRRVGGAGATGDEADAGAARELAPGLGHHGRASLLPAGDQIDAGADQRVEHAEVAFPRHAGGARHALDHELVDQHAGAGAFGERGGHLGGSFHSRAVNPIGRGNGSPGGRSAARSGPLWGLRGVGGSAPVGPSARLPRSIYGKMMRRRGTVRC